MSRISDLDAEFEEDLNQIELLRRSVKSELLYRHTNGIEQREHMTKAHEGVSSVMRKLDLE